jgi:hypothetical protein
MDGRETNEPGGLPGAVLVRKGIADLEQGVESVEALLVSMAAPRLTALGYAVSRPFPSAEHRLYERLAAEDPDAAHSRYNALVRRLVSFERAAECAS